MRLVVVSNRLPFTVSVRSGTPCFEASPGGLTTGLSSYLSPPGSNPTTPHAGPSDYLWLGWPGASVSAEHQQAVADYGRTHHNALPLFGASVTNAREGVRDGALFTGTASNNGAFQTGIFKPV